MHLYGIGNRERAGRSPATLYIRRMAPEGEPEAGKRLPKTPAKGS